MGSPPLARDKYLLNSFVSIVGGITPACAGQISLAFQTKTLDGDHPRLRGTNLSKGLQMIVLMGSPPLARDKFVTVSELVG